MKDNEQLHNGIDMICLFFAVVPNSFVQSSDCSHMNLLIPQMESESHCSFRVNKTHYSVVCRHTGLVLYGKFGKRSKK